MLEILFLTTCNYKEGFLVSTLWSSEWWPGPDASFKIPLKLSSYGLMLAIGFLFANYFLQQEFKRLNIPAKLADNIIIVGVIGGIVGSKLFFAWETSGEWLQSEGWSGFADRMTSGGGLTWYGGFIVAGSGIAYLIIKSKLRFPYVADIITPLLASGYGFGRLGCLFSGDGCYGEICPYNWPFPLAMSFPDGAAPTTAIVYNTPLFESIFSFMLFGYFWAIRKKTWPIGFKFVTFLALHSFARFLVEFIRVNPRDVFGVTQAQFISICVILACVAFFVYRKDDLVNYLAGGGEKSNQ